MIKRLIAISAMVASLVMTTWAPVYAAAQPDDMDIYYVSAFRHLLEDDDMLIVIHYDIEYASKPSEDADELFMFRFMNGSTELGLDAPYSGFDQRGYNEGIAGFYFSAADAPAWGGAYSVILQGNPVAYPDAGDWDEEYYLSAGEWSPYTTQADNQLSLWLLLVDLASDLEDDWTDTLLVTTSEGVVLNMDGTAYVSGCINNIQSMVPEAFTVSVGQPQWGEETWSKTYDEGLRTTSSGTAIAGLVEVVERNMNIPFMAAGTLLILIGYTVIMVLTYMRTGSVDGGILVGLPILLVGVRLGLVPMAGLAVFALLAVMLLGYVFFFRNA